MVSKLDTGRRDRMQCTKCGAQLPDGSSYCNICGKKQQAAAAEKAQNKDPGQWHRVGV